METEQWMQIKGWEIKYSISTFGNVRSLERSFTGINKLGFKYTMTRGGGNLKPFKNRFGYLLVTFIGDWKTFKNKKYTVHRLVAEAFIPNPENKEHVNHKDGNKLNNHVDNLEWATPKENSKHSVKNGLTSCIGATHYMTIFKPDDIILIRNSNDKDKILAEKYGVHHSTINKIRKRKNWASV